MIAIYARKSVFREDSISIESQIEHCCYEAKGEPYIVYSDNGYSGKNTERPEYQHMIEDIKSGKINKVIVYKLDRISRSILDFSSMMNLFQNKDVAFVSATEHFDTSSPMGRAMLNICIVFAQLERETIQQRVADAYVSRSQKGFYMGGRIPYGYTKTPITINGIKTSMYEIQPEEAEDIRLIYELYSNPTTSLGEVVRTLLTKLPVNRRGNAWCTARLSEMMRNPVYTFADKAIYDFYKSQGTNIVNPIEDFTGETSLYFYKGDNTNRKTWDLSGHTLVVAPHIGIVDSATWLICRRKLLNNHQVKYCKPKNSFLAGKIKCGHCGYSMSVRKSPRAKGFIKYFVDLGRSDYHVCSEVVKSLRVDDFEKEIVERIKTKLNSLNIQCNSEENAITGKIRSLNIQKEKLEEEIKNLINNLSATSNNIAMSYIEKRITELDKQIHEIDSVIQIERSKKQPNHGQIQDAVSKWDLLSFEDKRAVVELLIQKILVYKDHVEIIWHV